MAKPDAAAVAKLLNELAQRMELAGGNPYRARAYSRAAENLALTPVPLARLVTEGRLQEIPGVGEALAAVITEIYETGRYAGLDAMRDKAPEGVLELLRLPGLKADRIRKLSAELGIASVADLEKAARTDRLKSMKGFGPAFQAKVLQSIEMSRRPPGRHLHRAAAALEYATAEIRKVHPNWSQITPAGEFRRGCELISALSLVAVDPAFRGASEVLSEAGELIVHVTAPDRYGIALLLATGSEAHVAGLKTFAKKKGYTLDSQGLRKGRGVIAAQNEEGIYEALGLPYIAPELRETGNEIRLAANGHLPELVTLADIRGILHAHTDQSDGSDTLSDMAEATRARGYGYLGLTDHSQTAHYAGGLKADEVIEQQAAIDKLNKRSKTGFHIFKGIESDILADGSLDFPENILKRFDLVIASVHSKFRLGKKEQTDRIVKAIENPHTTVLGHVTGRQLLRRPGYEVDMERILRACAKHRVAVEINAHPWRLDIDWRWCRRALELGCMFSINPDAHSTTEIENVQWGVLMARKGGVPKNRVINALSLPDFRAYLDTKKHQSSKPRPKRPR